MENNLGNPTFMKQCKNNYYEENVQHRREQSFKSANRLYLQAILPGCNVLEEGRTLFSEQLEVTIQHFKERLVWKINCSIRICPISQNNIKRKAEKGWQVSELLEPLGQCIRLKGFKSMTVTLDYRLQPTINSAEFPKLLLFTMNRDLTF